MGGAKGTPPLSLKQTEFSLKQVAKTLGQANYHVFNKWKKTLVAGFFEKKHPSKILWQNRLKHLSY
jgi:hypothetical protein